jgi:hypothetical protein
MFYWEPILSLAQFRLSLRAWQISFLVLLGLAILLTGLFFGDAKLTGISGVVGVALSCVNAFLGSEKAEESEPNPVVSRLKLVLQVGPYLKGLCSLFLFYILGLLGFGIPHYIHRYYSIPINGVVRDSGQIPIDSALVTIDADGKSRHTTTTHGAFTFTDVDFREFPKREVTIVAQFGNQSTKQVVHFSGHHAVDVLLTFPPVVAPVRITFARLKGLTIEDLVRGIPDSALQSDLGKQPFVAADAVFRTLRSLVLGFSDHVKTVDEDGKVANQTYFAGVNNADVGDPGDEYLDDLQHDSAEWNAIVVDSNQVRFWRYAKPTQVKELAPSKWAKLYLHLTNGHSAPSFCILALHNDVCAGMRANLITEEIVLAAAIIENTSQKSITLGDFGFSADGTDGIRPFKQASDNLNGLPATHERLYTQGLLAPGEKLLLPLRIEVGFPFGGDEPLIDGMDSSEDRKTMLTELENKKVPLALQGFSTKPETLKVILERTVHLPTSQADFVYGPAMRLNTLAIDDVTYPVRSDQEVSYELRSAGQYGSCPYVFTWDATKNKWVNRGHILYKHIGMANDRRDSIPLSEFDGRLVIHSQHPSPDENGVFG